MKHKPHLRFWSLFEKLPQAVQDVARKQFRLLQQNPNHPSLHFKKLKGDTRLWSVRITRDYRAVAVLVEDVYVWSWIGTHAYFDRAFSRG